jgi:gamma-glutamyl hercynylcysteine S-oxide synthase
MSERIDHALSDAHAMRRADRELLSLALMHGRNRTLAWLAVLERVPLAGWIGGRAAWWQERWIARNVQRSRGVAADITRAPLTSIEPRADDWWAQAGSNDPGPTPEALRAYLAETLEVTLELLAVADGSDEALHWYRAALFEEDAAVLRLAGLAQRERIDVRRLLPERVLRAPREPLWFPAQRWMLGSARGGFVPPAEQWAHEEPVPEFEIDAQAVSWAQFCEFVEDGGYDQRAHWSDAGWAWVQREGRRTPRHVDQMRQGVLQRRFGKLVRVPMAQPVVHLCWFEADAWCRWAGRRLPSEVEWEAAAHHGATLGFRWGEVWEWTASSFRPYPGFIAGPVRDFSVPSFGTNKVLRGACPATRGRMRSATFRNFHLPDRDDIFAGFRSCSF